MRERPPLHPRLHDPSHIKSTQLSQSLNKPLQTAKSTQVSAKPRKPQCLQWIKYILNISRDRTQNPSSGECTSLTVTFTMYRMKLMSWILNISNEGFKYHSQWWICLKERNDHNKCPELWIYSKNDSNTTYLVNESQLQGCLISSNTLFFDRHQVNERAGWDIHANDRGGCERKV